MKDQIKRFLAENWFKLVIAVCAVVVAVGYLYSVDLIKPDPPQRGLKLNWEKINSNLRK